MEFLEFHFSYKKLKAEVVLLLTFKVLIAFKPHSGLFGGSHLNFPRNKLISSIIYWKFTPEHLHKKLAPTNY